MAGRGLLVLALLAPALLCSCDRNPLYGRLGADYFPVTTLDSEWEYSLGQGGSLVVSVVDQVVMGEKTAFKVQTGAGFSFWTGENGELLHYEDHSVIFNGFEVALYRGWLPYLRWPLAVGNCWSDSVVSWATSQEGVTISHDWVRKTSVLGLGSSSGYDDCYHVYQQERTIDWIQSAGFSPETTIVNRHMWLAPDVGMVFKSTADSTLTLTSYEPGP
ncbi:hypothetical protein JW921_03160 [Candidatus Fermentibacterales bacterium]|nr:hypothetical protein [Candidatus Fermentibacterales bacterium]